VVAGGAGPLHAAEIARELDIPALFVPRESSIFCAAGMLMSDFKHDDVRAYKTALADADAARLAALLDEMADAGRATLAREGVPADRAELQASLDLRYTGQWHELTVPIDMPVDPAAVAEAFHAEHDRLFGHSSPGQPVELLAVRLGVVGRTEKPDPTEGGEVADGEPLLGERPVWSRLQRALVATPVYDGERLQPGARVAGPAIVELPNTTIVVPESFELGVDAYRAFAVYAGERGAEFAAKLHGLGAEALR
jgi:N-methylhydantoinase A